MRFYQRIEVVGEPCRCVPPGDANDYVRRLMFTTFRICLLAIECMGSLGHERFRATLTLSTYTGI